MASRSPYSWRIIDVVIASVLGIACGLLFIVWNFIGGTWYSVADALTPGLGGLGAGIWFIGGVLGGLVIRKPGAAIYVEVLAAVASMALGSQWGIETMYSGLAQGIGAEIVFALFLYKRYSLGVAMLAGAGSAVGAWVLELFTSANLSKSLGFNMIYLSCLVISGAILAGLVGYYLVKALAATGVLDRFAAGKQARKQV